MGFGLFKKLKDFAKKGINWLKGALPKAKKIMDAAAPVVKEISNEKVKNYFEMANSGIDAINNAASKRNYNDVKNWVNYEIKPRLKH